jgi:hypothetical protein
VTAFIRNPATNIALRRQPVRIRVPHNNSNKETAMDIGTAIAGVNWLAVISATVVAFLLGSFWYSKKVFGTAWMQEIGLTEEAISEAHTPIVLGGTFMLQFIAAMTLALFMGSDSDWLIGLQAGLLIGIGWIAAVFGITYFFEQRSVRLYLINTGYYIVLFATMGAIVGAWN